MNGAIFGFYSLRDEVARYPGVAGVTPFVYSGSYAFHPDKTKGVVLRGVDPKTAREVLGVLPGSKHFGGPC